MEWSDGVQLILDPTSRTTSLVGSMNLPPSSFLIGLAYDEEEDKLYAVATPQGVGTSNLYEVDTTTGNASFIGSTGVPTIDGLAWKGETLFPTPVDITNDLIDDVIALDLPGGLESSLLAQLNGAPTQIEKGNFVAAVNMLKGFKTRVETQRDKEISGADADNLIAVTNRIINLLTT